MKLKQQHPLACQKFLQDAWFKCSTLTGLSTEVDILDSASISWFPIHSGDKFFHKTIMPL